MSASLGGAAAVAAGWQRTGVSVAAGAGSRGRYDLGLFQPCAESLHGLGQPGGVASDQRDGIFTVPARSI